MLLVNKLTVLQRICIFYLCGFVPTIMVGLSDQNEWADSLTRFKPDVRLRCGF